MLGFTKNIPVLAILAVIGFVSVLSSQQGFEVVGNRVQAPFAPLVTANGAMLMSSTNLPDGTQQVVLIDVALKSMTVYHIQMGSGVISLRSQRNLDADFRMDEFNTLDPTPEKIRAILPR